jgi:solute carrier family 10 (sodium/bile acid cotransporter), member 3/5
LSFQLAFSIALGLLSTEIESKHLWAIGLFVTGCSPGGGASNYWTILLGGNANLSITMTFISTIGAMGNSVDDFKYLFC